LSVSNFDQVVAIAVALPVVLTFYAVADRHLDRSWVASMWVGAATVLAVSVLSISRLSIKDDALAYESLFRTQQVPLYAIKQVAARRRWSVLPLPKQVIVLILNGSDGVNGSQFRIGVFSWPDARTWARAVVTRLSVVSDRYECAI
jgi:hypothetical protein